MWQDGSHDAMYRLFANDFSLHVFIWRAEMKLILACEIRLNHFSYCDVPIVRPLEWAEK